MLDTNILIYDPEAIFQFEDNQVIITGEVVKELDKLKQTKYNARETVKQLKKLDFEIRETDYIKVAVAKLDNGGEVLVERIFSENDNRYNDISIMYKAKKYDATLITKDNWLQVMANLNGIPVEDYKNNSVEKFYTGNTVHQGTKEEVDQLFNSSTLDIEDTFVPNQFVNVVNGQSSVLSKYQNGKLHLVRNQMVHGIQGKNREQIFALDCLMNTDIDLVTLTGVAGVGKTLLALASGLEQVLEEKTYKKLIVTRPVVPMGNELGYLPGDLEEKLKPWVEPIYDNVDFLYQDADRNIVEDLKCQNKLKIEALQYIRGRSIPNQFILLDEAQNLTPKEIKTVITRVGEGTKIVLTGDIEQIDHQYLDKKTNGLSYTIKCFKGQDNFAHINLEKTERSKLASQSANLM